MVGMPPRVVVHAPLARRWRGRDPSRDRALEWEIRLGELVRALHIEVHLGRVGVVLARATQLENAVLGFQPSGAGALVIAAEGGVVLPEVLRAMGFQIVVAAQMRLLVVAVGPPARLGHACDGSGPAVDETEVAVVEVGVGLARGEVAFEQGVPGAVLRGGGPAEGDPSGARPEAVSAIVDLAIAFEVAGGGPAVGLVAFEMDAVVAVCEGEEGQREQGHGRDGGDLHICGCCWFAKTGEYQK